MFQFLTVIFNNVVRSLEISGKRRAQHYITHYNDKGLWK